MKKLIFALFATVILLSSCVSADKIKVLDVSEPLTKSPTEFVLSVTVENNNGQNIKLKDAKFDISLDGRVLARAITGETIVIPRKRTSEIEIPIRLSIRDLVGIVALSQDADRIDQLKISGSVIVKAGMLRKRYEVDNVSLIGIAPMLYFNNK